jgi:uncharacterized protein YjdB
MKYQSFKSTLSKYKTIFLSAFLLSSSFIGFNAVVAGEESAELSTGLSIILADIAEAILPEREPDFFPVTNLTLSISNASLFIGTSTRITPTISPSNASDKSLIWSSSNVAIVEVTSGGIAIARDFGEATITAQSSHPSIQATLNVTVIDFPDVADFVMEAYVDASPVTSFDVGTSAKLQLSQITPAFAKTSNLVYESSDPLLATVNQDGVIIGVSPGEVTIFADFGETRKSIQLTITQPDIPSILPSFLSLEGPSIGYVGRTLQLEPDFGDNRPTDTQLTYKSSATHVARVNDLGVVTGVNFSGLTARQVTITAYANANPTVMATLELTIEKVFPTSVTLSSVSRVTAGNSIQINPTFLPADTTDRQLVWSSSNVELATVSSGGDFGLLVGKFSGTVTITATSVMDPSITSTMTLTILPAPLFSPAQWEAFLMFVRKGIGHFTLNFINGVLGFLTFYAYIDEKKKYRDVLLSLAVGIPLSALFESFQFFAPGRSPTWLDAFYNTSGYASAQLGMMILLSLITFVAQRKTKKKQKA